MTQPPPRQQQLPDPATRHYLQARMTMNESSPFDDLRRTIAWAGIGFWVLVTTLSSQAIQIWQITDALSGTHTKTAAIIARAATPVALWTPSTYYAVRALAARRDAQQLRHRSRRQLLLFAAATAAAIAVATVLYS